MFVDNFGFWLVVIGLFNVSLYLFSWFLLWRLKRGIRSEKEVRLQIYLEDLEQAKREMQLLNEKLYVLKRADACNEACMEGHLKTTAAIEMMESALRAAETRQEEELTPGLDTLHRGIWRLLALLQLSISIAEYNFGEADDDDGDDGGDDDDAGDGVDGGGATDLVEDRKSNVNA